MPNRMLRDWTRSETVDKLSCDAERFFTRLIMRVDDYGCFFADVRILKGELFILKLDKIREADISRWMVECQKAGLIVLYESEGKQYLQIHDFRQRLDRAKSKFPKPVNVLPAVVNELPPEVEVEQKGREGAREGLENSNLFRKPNIPTKQQVLETVINSGGTKEMAKSFWQKYDGLGWYLNGSPIVNYVSLASKFVTSWKDNEEKGKPKTDENFNPHGHLKKIG